MMYLGLREDNSNYLQLFTYMFLIMHAFLKGVFHNKILK